MMTAPRLPPGEDWKDHTVPCPNCGEPVLSDSGHYVGPTHIDDGYWECDASEEDE